MLDVILIDNGVHGLRDFFVDGAGQRYRQARIGRHWQPDFSGADLVIAPNGTDHVALHEARAAVADYLDEGGVLACFCGFFTPWIPGNRWIHDVGRPLDALTFDCVEDRLGLLDGVDLERFAAGRHGIRGGWACGRIETAHAQSVVLRDSHGRVVMVADMQSTAGLIVATASGPLGDGAPDQPVGDSDDLSRIYRNLLNVVRQRKERQS
ncbi:hypothetical protein [Nevskia sp.]|uniref:hypothetical protein n=1 Tax=Nevskia sp. TaxID=1929292 RepID=UPI0025D56183|nr:hypothetical protein [Nevskia sp.]